MDMNRPGRPLPSEQPAFPQAEYLLRLSALLTLILTVPATVGQTLVLKFGYDPGKGVFAAGNSAGTILSGALFLFAALLLFAAFFTAAKADAAVGALPPCSSAEAFFSAMGGGLVLSHSLLALLTDAKEGAALSLTVVLLLLSLPAAASMVMNALSGKRNAPLLTGLGFFPVLWFAVSLLRLYFDRSSAINDPVRILSQISLAALMLFFLIELRTRVGKPRIGYSVASAAVASLLGITYSASALIARLTGTDVLGGDLLLCCAELCLSLYALLRLFSLKKSLVPLPADKQTGQDCEPTGADGQPDDGPEDPGEA